ncbi:hypothetical protein WMF11_03445 [Sorangium sp. So ce295]|uniref:hypothetical protein n=1 Tax=Sorangium sp. So ce295 TaxID=3133295 RepID=UPI003F5E8B45
MDARADVYAVGLLMYTLVVGHGPFAHVEDALGVLRAHVVEPPAPPSRYAGQQIPAELDRAVLKALAKRPEERFQSAEAFGEELGRIAGELAEGGGTWRAGRAPAAEAGWGPQSRAWFEAVAEGTSGVRAGGGVTAEAAPVDAWVFAGLTLASTAVFSAIAALVLRGMGVW